LNEISGAPALSVFNWIIWMQRVDPSFNWNLPWSSYRNGFGLLAGDFWLGLEIIHQLTTSANYRLRIEVQRQDTLLWYSVEYWSFVVGDESTSKYQLKVYGLATLDILLIRICSSLIDF
jgi:hypothetical protein